MGDQGQGIRLQSSARTSVGQVRENNEDSIHLWSKGGTVLAIVADGMGGAAAGEEASRLAVEAVQDGMGELEVDDEESEELLPAVTNVGDETLASLLQEFIRTANSNIMKRAANDPGLEGMGTTITMAFVRQTQAIVAHVGDSRAYRVSARDRNITQITSDHSFVQVLLAAGHITKEQAENHPLEHVLYRALGQTEDLDIDVYETSLRVGDRLVLCSDGLTRHVNPDEISSITLSSETPDEASDALIDLANARGGEDNVSVIVIMVAGTDPNEDVASEDHTFSTGWFSDDDTIELDRVLTETGKLDNPISRRAQLLKKQREERKKDKNSTQEVDKPDGESTADPTASADNEGRDSRISEEQ